MRRSGQALPLSTDFASAIKPMVEIIVDGWDLSGNATVLSAELEIASRNQVCFRYKVKACSELERQRRQRAASPHGKKKRRADLRSSDSSGASSGDPSESENSSDRSVSSIDSSVDLDAESDVEAEDSGGYVQPDEEMGAVERGEPEEDWGGAPWKRLAKNSHTDHQNDYATFIDNFKFPNVKVVLRPSLCVAHLLGTRNMSKTIYSEQILEKRESPVLSLLLLRAWVVYRLRAKRLVRQSSVRRSVGRSVRRRSVVRSASRPFDPPVGRSVGRGRRGNSWTGTAGGNDFSEQR